MKALADIDPEGLLYDWKFWARPNQLAPAGNWLTWLILAGRGFGKTRAGAEWVRSMVCGSTPLAKGKAGRVALVGETAADCRDVMVRGDSGLLSVHHPDFRPVYQSSNRSLTWPNGATALLFNATEPDQLRGPQFDLAWCDELAKWRYAQEAWDMLQFGLRLGDDPRQLVTTTPRPIPLIRMLLKDDRTVTTKGSTYDNRANLAGVFMDTVIKRYEGTRLGRQELNAEVLDDIPGSLWTRDGLDRHRVDRKKLPDMQRIVVAVDPAATSSETAKSDATAETGIVVCGLGTNNRGYVLDDQSCRESPNGWGRRAISCYDQFSADAIVVERNQGGDMVANTLRSVRQQVPIIEVHASRGKVTRAEPVSAMYEQGRVSHVGSFPTLEDQMVLFTTNGIVGDTTADRVDALVWAFTELFPSMVNNIGDNVDFYTSSGRGAGWMAS
jgi:phage terminase large subunit-like protein